MIFRRKMVERCRFAEIRMGGRFYYYAGPTLYGPATKIGRTSVLDGYISYWDTATGAPVGWTLAGYSVNTGTRVARFPKAFEPYEAVQIQLPT